MNDIPKTPVKPSGPPPSSVTKTPVERKVIVPVKPSSLVQENDMQTPKSGETESRKPMGTLEKKSSFMNPSFSPTLLRNDDFQVGQAGRLVRISNSKHPRITAMCFQCPL